MQTGVLIGTIVALSCVGYLWAVTKAKALENNGAKLHSRPRYYGVWALLSTLVPSVLLFVLWQFISYSYLEHQAILALAEQSNGHPVSVSLVLARVRSLVAHPQLMMSAASITGYDDLRRFFTDHGVVLPVLADDYEITIARHWLQQASKAQQIGSLLVLVAALIGLISGLVSVKRSQRARNKVEKAISRMLMGASTIAILTTIGIILSLLFQTIHFFHFVSPFDFFFGTVWDPRFAAAGSASVGQFGLVPLLAGTLYVAFVAMLIAVPIGLFSAIYMAEYASSRSRTFIKPLLEILAGIPTIVYGFFALITVGPFLRDLSASLTGGKGFIMAQSVLTAGFVMAIMLIPFISSLSDDILTAVPRSLRDGSYGLGATKSETIKRVILPAALPGITGALLLAASRAIGETMIVVLAAGVAANLTANPFAAMTTITVKIVNQLTGDLEFNSPQTLVAYALGLTLFLLTLVMNIVALYIVRKYREQYE